MILGFLGCAKESNVLSEEEIKTYCSVYPVFVQTVESERETFIKIIEQCTSPDDLLARIESYIKARQDFPNIDNRMKALGMSFTQFMKTYRKLGEVHAYCRAYDGNRNYIDSLINILRKTISNPKIDSSQVAWGGPIIDQKSPEYQEQVKKSIKFLEKIKNIPKENIELFKKYEDVIIDLWSEPSL